MRKLHVDTKPGNKSTSRIALRAIILVSKTAYTNLAAIHESQRKPAKSFPIWK